MSRQSLFTITVAVIAIIIAIGFWVYGVMEANDIQARIDTAEAQLVVTEEQAIECQERVEELLELLEDCGLGSETEPAVSSQQEEPCVTVAVSAGG
jgi:hypothetical protein